jgi:hypothetical protein
MSIMTRQAALHELRIARAFVETYIKEFAASEYDATDQDDRISNAAAHITNAIVILMEDDLEYGDEPKGGS